MACYSNDVMGGAFYFTQSIEYIYIHADLVMLMRSWMITFVFV